MSYCVNCGKEYDNASAICPHCFSDQSIPNEVIEAELSKNKLRRPDPHDVRFGFPGEKGALVLSIVISSIVAIILGAISFGLFFGILILNLFYLKVRHISSQKNMIRISNNNFKAICSLSKVAAFRLKVPQPEVYIVHDPQYNAHTLGFYKYGFIVINSAIASDFRPEELLFVIGHELGHMKRYHTTWLNLTTPAREGGANFIFAPVMKAIFNVWSVKAEFTADQAGLIACQEVGPAISSLLKIAGGPDIEKEVDVTKIVHPQGEAADILSGMAEYLSAHPFIESRIKQLIYFSSRRERQPKYN
jgi:Zn-dependent protease with chaperone function